MDGKMASWTGRKAAGSCIQGRTAPAGPTGRAPQPSLLARPRRASRTLTWHRMIAGGEKPTLRVGSFYSRTRGRWSRAWRRSLHAYVLGHEAANNGRRAGLGLQKRRRTLMRSAAQIYASRTVILAKDWQEYHSHPQKNTLIVSRVRITYVHWQTESSLGVPSVSKEASIAEPFFSSVQFTWYNALSTIKYRWDKEK